MKPVYLEFSGINSFSETAQINFSALLSGGVFGIFGDTGSGKSTILDSIHFALYGEIDRVPKSFNDCINHRCDAAKVTFDFEITSNGIRKTYRVQRERKRKTGGTKAYLYEYTDDKTKPLAIAEGTREVDEKIEQIIGLSYADFKMCIALPQGDFAALVKSTTAERVKLVSRLFNLEKYGEKLSKSINERYYKAEEEVNLIQAKIGENEGAGEEKLTQTAQAIQTEKQTLSLAQTRLKQADEQYALAQEMAKAKQRYDELCRCRTQLDNQLPQMQDNQRLIDRYPAARSIAEKHKLLQDSIREAQLSEKRLLQAQTDYDRVTAKYNQAQQAFEKAGYRDKIFNISLKLERVRMAGADIQAAKIAEQSLQDCIAEYKTLDQKFPKRDFVSERIALDNQLSALGADENLLDYIKRTCKTQLVGDVYAAIRTDLSMLAEKYPQTQADISSLLEKYTLSQADNATSTLDFQALDTAFKKMEESRKQLRKQSDELEKARLMYEENESKKKLLIEQGKLLRENHQAALAKIAAIQDLGDATALQTQITALQTSETNDKTQIETLQRQVGDYYAEIQKQTGLKTVHTDAQQQNTLALQTSLTENGFADADEALSLLNCVGDVQELQRKTQAFFQQYALIHAEYEKINPAAFEHYDANQLTLARENKTQAQTAVDISNQTLGALEREYARLTLLREKYKAQLKELQEKEKYKNLCDELRAMVRSNRFLEFIATEYLQEISLQASKTLLSLTGGRYFLKYEKEFKVGDNLDGGNLRAVKTLSGGETFLVSLSLALSLSATICLKSLRPIEFFFLDEGFGTLDGKLVDTVMDVLGKLSKTFAVGLISHVEELKHRIENKIVVSGATESRGSQVKVECY